MVIEANINDTYSLVEGEWKGLEFRKIQPEDWDKVVKHIQDNFLRDEPTFKLLGYSDEFGKDFDIFARKMLADDLSFLVEDKTTGEIAAVRVTHRHTIGKNVDDIPVTSQSMKMAFRIKDIIEKEANIFEVYGVGEYADFFVASCNPKYRKRGITTELYIRSLKFLKAQGFKLAKSVLTSPYTRTAVKKLGFEEVCRLDYHEFVDNMGQLVFKPEELTDEHFAALMVKSL